MICLSWSVDILQSTQELYWWWVCSLMVVWEVIESLLSRLCKIAYLQWIISYKMKKPSIQDAKLTDRSPGMASDGLCSCLWSVSGNRALGASPSSLPSPPCLHTASSRLGLASPDSANRPNWHHLYQLPAPATSIIQADHSWAISYVEKYISQEPEPWIDLKMTNRFTRRNNRFLQKVFYPNFFFPLISCWQNSYRSQSVNPEVSLEDSKPFQAIEWIEE